MTQKRHKKKVLLTRTFPDFAIKELKKHYDIQIHKGPFPIPKNQLISKIKDKDGLICYPYDYVDKKVIDAAKNLKAISTFSVGYDHIDINYAKKHKIIIGYTPEVLTVATADLTIILILDIIRRVTEGDRLVRKGNWKQVFGADTYVGQEIPQQTLGIFGLGRIGREVAKKAQVFGMKVIYHNRKRLSKNIEKKLKVKWSSFDSLFKNSDVVSILVPYSKQTHELVNMKLLKKMKKTAFLVNTARGKIVKESDLVSALRKKIIAGAALDVYYTEPISSKHPLTKLENVILAPHIGSSSVKTRNVMCDLTVKNLKLALAGKKPLYSV